MKQDELNQKHYISDDNHAFFRKSDNLLMGNDMYLSDNDSITNYQEKEYKFEVQDIDKEKELMMNEHKMHQKNIR